MKTLLAIMLVVPSIAFAKTITNDDLIKPGTTSDTIVKLKCGEKTLITNVLPYPKGCVVVDKRDDARTLPAATK